MNNACQNSGTKLSRITTRTAAEAGFSLIELLAVAAILLILTTLYWGSGTGNRQRRQKAACQQNLERIFMAMQVYANDQAGRFPSAASARTSGEALVPLVPRYTVDTSVFVCPATEDSPPASGVSLKQHPISYAYYMGRHATDSAVLMSDRQVDTQAKTVGQPVFSSTGKPPGNNHGNSGGNFLFCDGHAEPAPTLAQFPLDVTNGVALLNP
jgi:prepilin-type N-terminal cleavage/methylation domain-containing protein/prepilin-type processing-associated H-X9-DG protein